MAALAQSIRRSAIGLGLFAVITGGTIAVTQAFTAQRIQEQAARAEARALFEIIPEHYHDNNMLTDTVELPPGDTPAYADPVTVWVARQQGHPTGIIMPVTAPDGYSGEIHLLLGVDMEGRILGVRITGHKETPGLGDRIETKKSDWVQGFNGQSLGTPPYREWNVRKDGGEFDQFTGATITPRAVVKAVKNALIYFRSNQQDILARLKDAHQPEHRDKSEKHHSGQPKTTEHS